MTALQSAPSASALRIVLAAERLFAAYGIDGVSLRQISAEAGSGNNSAVHYHFGSKDGLIRAIFDHRIPQLTRDRQLLAARRDPQDLRSIFEAQFLPVLLLAADPEAHYVSFVEQLQRHPESHLVERLSDVWQESNTEFAGDIARLLGHLDGEVRGVRIQQAEMACLHAAADYERDVAAGVERERFELFAGSLFDGITGFLAAPTGS